MVSLFVVHDAMLRRLRLLIACLVLSVVAQPAVTALEMPRTVAVLSASAADRAPHVASLRVAARAASSSSAHRTPLAWKPADVAAPWLAALEHQPLRGLPLYVTQQRILL